MMLKALSKILLILLPLCTLAHGDKSYPFIKNKGQWDSRIQYNVLIPNGNLYLESGGLTYHLIDKSYIKSLHSQNQLPQPDSVQAHGLFLKFEGSNENVRITKTGNYIIEIYDDEDEIVFSKKFIVYRQKSNVGVGIKRSRDLTYIESKQIVQFTITPVRSFFNNPKTTIKTLVFKNNNIKDNITNLKPQYTVGNQLIYRYDQEAAFWAGNEYFYFDNKDLRGGNIFLSHYEIKYLYHNFLHINKSRAYEPYTYNPDINGAYVVKTLTADNNDIEADYVQMHFSLENYENMGNRKIYIIGQFNDFMMNAASELKYNQDSGLYENTSLIKQGFVNYKFVALHNNEVDHSLIDGNFYQTENEYTVVVYYRDLGARYDEVIGVGSANSINISN